MYVQELSVTTILPLVMIPEGYTADDLLGAVHGQIFPLSNIKMSGLHVFEVLWWVHIFGTDASRTLRKNILEQTFLTYYIACVPEYLHRES